MKTVLTNQEAILLLLYAGDHPKDTISNLKEMQEELTSDEQDLLRLSDGLIGKLRSVSDNEFRILVRQVDEMV